MKKLLFTLLFLLNCSIAFANPSVFGLTIGGATIEQMKEKYAVKHTGENAYSHGSMYSIDASQIPLEGLEEVLAIFDTENKLVAVVSTVNKKRYDYLKDALGKKYTYVNGQNPFVGDKSARFKDGDTIIILDAPHMSFKMSMIYTLNSFYNKFMNDSAEQKEQKAQAEDSML